MEALETLQERRRRNWCQVPDRKVPDPDAAVEFLERVGIASLFPASAEVPSLYQAHMGDPEPPTFQEWDSPSGLVYTWRWDLGRRQAALYTSLVCRRPTWIRWDLVPVVLRLFGDLRTAEEQHEAGELSRDALRLAAALQSAGEPLSTGDLRREAGFPTGKENRAAYLKAVEELESRLLLVRLFRPETEDTFHTLTSLQHPERVAQAGKLSREEALASFLHTYLSTALYALPKPLARHLRLPEPLLRSGLEALAATGEVTAQRFPGQAGDAYVSGAAP